MPIKPQIHNNTVKHAHPLGCKKRIEKQIQRVKQATIHCNKRLRVLILGSSSGIGLASRIALTFGEANADTIGVSLDTNPTPHSEANAGYYNNQWFKHFAEIDGHTAVNIQGDVFSPQTKIEVIEAIETYFEGEVDLIVYSIASTKRRKPNSKEFWHAVIKPMNTPLHTNIIDFSDDSMSEVEIPPATDDEILSTKKVMGGEDWASWVETLINSESISNGCRTLAFSYIGPELTNPIYLEGTLGHAKVDLHQTSHSLNMELANFGGSAHAVVCKTLVTRASVVIPGLLPYLTCLESVLDSQNRNEDALSQMMHLFYEKLSDPDNIQTDSERLIRLDETELSSDIQLAVTEKLKKFTPEKLSSDLSYQSVKKQFLQLNGYNNDEE
ncbi:enoyl-[acyl-carrier-protein] reductase FabV [Vibrio salinus]|uniref:enoyl-[acyl-carrier-protein] reductase FabV n=1 Tax=Vibrio salinus TaxID=2899784 RepID=UPI001E5069A7|nr:enoyl-[acyl-carrier-protein] reductase FabV [Vibrio salinus]MCE0496060.1 enoyl-[acyl-carrier-protein] reductase FabV [Vibrio salinus]